MALAPEKMRGIEVEVDASRRARHATEREEWIASLSPKDWLFDGYPIRGDAALDRWNGLDWTQAYMDMGPSVAGNLGPYWHVPLPSEETVHRLYPKVLTTKWLLTIRQAIGEAYGWSVNDATGEADD